MIVAQSTLDVSSPAVAAYASTVGCLLTALTGFVWRLGNKIGALADGHKSQEARLDRIQAHMEEHDRWHLGRLTEGKDLK